MAEGRCIVDAIRGNFFRADAWKFGDRTGSIEAAHDVRASERVRACEVGLDREVIEGSIELAENFRERRTKFAIAPSDRRS
jgi:hypothetical protein